MTDPAGRDRDAPQVAADLANDPRTAIPRHTAAPLLGALALAMVPGVLLADALVLFSRGWRPLGTLNQAAFAAVTTAVIGSFIPLAFGPARRLLARLGPRLMLLSTSVLLSLAMFGFGLSMIMPEAGFHLRPAGMLRVHRTDPEVMPGIEGDSRYTINAEGIRGPELPADRAVPRILCIGGSTTECLYLDDDETWPNLLAERLATEHQDGTEPIWLGAIGLAGYSSVHHLKFIEEHPLVQSRGLDAAIFLVGVNDLWKVYLGVTEAQQLAGDLEPLWTRSRLAGYLHGRLDRWRASKTGGLEHWAVHVPRQQRERSEGEKVDRGPELGPWLDQYAERLRRIAGTCRDQGVRPIFVSQPVQWAEGLPPEVEGRFWFGWLEGGGYVSARVLREGMEAFNARLAEVAEAEGVPLIDLSPMHGDSRWFFDDCHFTEAGAREAARLIGDALLAEPTLWRP